MLLRGSLVLVVAWQGDATVVQPNEDGSYWRKIVRNKMIRMKEKRRVQAGKAFVDDELKLPAGLEGKVVSSWGPYTSIVGTAVKTSVAGLTAQAELTANVNWGKMAPDVHHDPGYILKQPDFRKPSLGDKKLFKICPRLSHFHKDDSCTKK